MSIFEAHKHNQLSNDANQIEAVAPDKQEYKFVGSIQHKAGMKIFSFNPENGEVKEVILKTKAALTLDGDVDVNHQAQYDPRLTYIQAINKKNAIRKFAQGRSISFKH